jgi:hypothetical protein
MRIIKTASLSGFAVALCILQPGHASAATSDEEFWLEAGAKGDISRTTDLKVKVETRRREGDNEYIFAGEVNTDVAKNLQLGGGVEIHDIEGFTEIRPYQQITLKVDKFDFRSRLEERFYDDADQMALRFRQRARFRQPLNADKSTQGYLSGELLYQLRDRTEGGPERIDQWRLGAGLIQKLGAFDVTAGYLLQIRPRDGGNTRHTHVAQVSLLYGF